MRKKLPKMIGEIKGYRNSTGIKIPRNNKKSRNNRKERKKGEPRIGMSYGRYIKSKEWEERKNKYYRTHMRICAKCGSMIYVQLHHMLYDRKTFGNEPDNILIALCIFHHKEFHRKYGTKTDMIENTLKFISE